MPGGRRLHMRYICTVCGYVYDDAKEAVPFASLPESWTCPLCGAAKSLFVPENSEKQHQEKPSVSFDEDLHELSAMEISAICSNLARGCEKQYLSEESELFLKLASWFRNAAPAAENPDPGTLSDLLKDDLDVLYPALSETAEKAGDRGTLRVCTWGAKVTAVLWSLLERYRKEGSSFLKDTKIWVCSVCGFVYVGEQPPELCPVCKVPAWKFEAAERGAVQ